MPPLRVLFAIGSLEVGGAERQVIYYLKWLDRSRFTPALYLIARRGPLLAEVPDDVPVFAFESRVAATRLYVPGRIHRRQGKDLATVLDEFDPHLLVTRSFYTTLIAERALRRRPTLHVAVDASDPRRDFARNAGRFQFLKRRIIARAYRRANVVVGLSRGAAEGIAAFYRLPRERVRVLPNLVDLAAIDHLAAEGAPGLAAGHFNVVSVGRLVPEKGHRDLIEAVTRLVREQRLPNLRLHLLGDGPLRSELEAATRRSEIERHVVFKGFERNPFRYLSRCDAFCLPSHNEGMPGALLEAMACQTPVIATDCESGPREILQGGKFGKLVPVGDPKSLATAIGSITRAPAAAKATAVAARRRIEEEYSIPVGIARLERLLREAANATDE